MFAKETRNYDLALQDPLFGPAAFPFRLFPPCQTETTKDVEDPQRRNADIAQRAVLGGAPLGWCVAKGGGNPKTVEYIPMDAMRRGLVNRAEERQRLARPFRACGWKQVGFPWPRPLAHKR
jgi:hypothetical protein